MENIDESKDLNCTEENCGGSVDLNNHVRVQTGCHSYTTAYACNVCGRLHFLNVDYVICVNFRSGQKAYLTKNGQIENRD